MFAAVLRSYLIRLIPVCTAAFIRLQIASPETGTLQGSRTQTRGPWHPVPELRGPFSTPDAHSPHVLLWLRAFSKFFSCYFILDFSFSAFLTNTTIILIWNKISLHSLSWMLQLSCLIYWLALCFCPCDLFFFCSTNSLFITIKCGLRCHTLKSNIPLLCP